MKINGRKINSPCFAYDGCHKIYLCEDEDDMKKAEETGYEIRPIEVLVWTWCNSCELRFISNWKLTEFYVPQYADEPVFEDFVL